MIPLPPVVRMGLGLLFGPAHEVLPDGRSGLIVALCGERPGSGIRFGLAGVPSGEDAVTCEGCLAVSAGRVADLRVRQAAHGRALGPDYETATVEAAAAVAALDPEPEEYWPPEEHWPPEDDREPGALDDDRDDCGCPDPGCPCDGRKRGGAP